jgi:tRNA dimethylallyltransferase
MPPADPVIRAQIAAAAAAHGWPHIHQQLARVDPQAAARIHPHHAQRLSRALEVYQASGIPLTQWHKNAGPAAQDRWRVLQLAISPVERSVLHERIARRFASMMAAGLLEEVRQLWQRPDLDAGLPSARAVGYRQLWQHLEGECDLDEAVKNAVAATRQLAKRQLTWLRKWPHLQWIYTDRAGNLPASGVSDEQQDGRAEKPLALALKYLGQSPL